MRKPEQPHEALEQELEALASADGHDLGEDEVRKRMRVIKNRLSAKKSREQARTYVQQLQSSISALMAQHQALARRLAAVEYENATLRHQLYYSQPLTPPQNHIDKPAVGCGSGVGVGGHGAVEWPRPRSPRGDAQPAPPAHAHPGVGAPGGVVTWAECAEGAPVASSGGAAGVCRAYMPMYTPPAAPPTPPCSRSGGVRSAAAAVAAAGKRKRPEPPMCEEQTGVAQANLVQIKQEEVVARGNDGDDAQDGAPAIDVCFAEEPVHESPQDQVPDLWFCCEHEGSPFTESDEEFMPFA